MSTILVLSMSRAARDIMRRSLSKRSSLYAGWIGNLLETLSPGRGFDADPVEWGEKNAAAAVFFLPSPIALILTVLPNQLSTVRGIRCPIARVPSPRARRVPPPIARRCARLSGAGRSESEEHRSLR